MIGSIFIRLGLLFLSTVLVAIAEDSTNPSSPDDVHFRYHPKEYAASYQALRQEINADLLDSKNESLTTCTKSGSKNNLVVAAIQMKTVPSPAQTDPAGDAREFLKRAEEAVEKAAKEHGATLILLQELFLGPYFCQSQNAALFSLAENDVAVESEDVANGNPIISRMRKLAKRLGVVLPISIFEKKNNAFFNSVVMIDADGSILGTYRKSHIPDGTGYQEKFYFSPGDTGFKVFKTKVGTVGVGICWDQWFPEAARSMALMGADILLYPTAIGTEPQDATLDSSDHWQRTMQGHSAANMVPVVASNRIGTEILLNDKLEEQQRITFYGRSFITDNTGAIIEEADGSLLVDIISAEIDVEANRSERAAWGLFRDRRPDLYGILKTKDGYLPSP